MRTYTLPGTQNANVWYIQDEVGSALGHSDQPNVRCIPFLQSPNNKINDPSAITYCVMWPVKDIKKEDTLYRDVLEGYTEKEFRSARMGVWFNTPEQYFADQLTSLRNFKVQYNVAEAHDKFQGEH